MVTMKALDRKLLRDLWSLKTQVVSIALVIACGIGGFIGTFSTYGSLLQSRDDYYATARFPHVFATAKRAPQALLERIGNIPGVVEVEARVVREAQLSIPGVVPPMIARLIGQDFEHPAAMNRLTLKSGRWPAPGARGEMVVNQRFLQARHLKLGDTMNVLLNGKLERVTLVGTALSPEYIFATRGGGMPDDEWFAVLWTDAHALAAAFNMEGAFNSVLLRLSPDASLQRAIEALDAILEPYGSLGAVGREDQISHKIITQEINQQRIFGTVLPAIFLLVAAFILNVVLHRQVHAQRGEIAALKALGYDDRRIAWHYLKFASVIVLLGTLTGVALGWWLGNALTGLYTDLFQFPQFHYFVPAWLLLAGAAAALVAAFGAALAATRGILRLHAAEALRPPAPAEFRALLLERLGYAHLLTSAQRMILRNLERRPVRAASTIAGIAGSVAILIAGTFWADSLEWFIDVQFNQVQRADINVGFAEPVPRSVRGELERLPGVSQAEVTRAIPVRLRAGHRSYRTGITGVEDQATLQRILDADLREAKPAPGGVLLTARLAERLGVRPGDTVIAELLEGKRVKSRGTGHGYGARDGRHERLDAPGGFEPPGARKRPGVRRRAVGGARAGKRAARAPERNARRGGGDRQPRAGRDFSRHQRAQRAVLHHGAQHLRRDHRGRRGVQQRAHPARREGVGARQPAGARVHAARGLGAAAGRARGGDCARHPARLPGRILARGAAGGADGDGGDGIPAGHLPEHLRLFGRRGGGGGRGERAHRAQSHR